MSDAFFPDIVVNGDTIPASDVSAELQNHNVPQGKQALAWRRAARALAIRALLLQEAKKRNLDANTHDIGPGKNETETEALIRTLLEQALPETTPDETALRAYYDANPERFRAPALYEASHILFAADETAPAREKARIRAVAALGILTHNPDQFRNLARNESDCTSRQSDGRLGQISRGETVEAFDRMLDQLEPGAIAPEPIETRFGFHILRLDAKAPGDILPFENAKPRIAEATEKAAWTRAANEFVTDLVSHADISGIDMRPE
jgi:peptidyl-prolyl cis-trans isomerase C